MKARYSLSTKIAGFDFFPWLVMARAHGATEVVFDTRRPTTSKWPIETVRQRFDSILAPGCALLGMPYSIGTDGRDDIAPYHQRDLVRLVREGMQVPRLKSVLPPGNARYTVTLRRTQRSPGRNSRELNWQAFAREIGAHVIPDYEDRPIHLHERMALYAGAEQNFFVTNGPVMLCFLSEYPAMGFCVNESPMTGFGVPFGEKYPFCLPQHHQIYETDELDVIRRNFEEWKASRPA